MIEDLERYDIRERAALYHILSRNNDKREHLITDEEKLQLIMDELRLEYDIDIAEQEKKDRDKKAAEAASQTEPSEVREVREEDREDDIRLKFANFSGRLEAFRVQFNQVSVGYCRLMAMPRVMLGLVMASRLKSHFVHTSWFKVATLNRMIGVHAGVSEQYIPEVARQRK
jgi:hypothetical protein